MGQPTLAARARDPCARAALGDGAYCATWFDPAADRKVLHSCAGGRTAKRTVCERGCRRTPDGVDDACDLGERSRMMERAEQWVKVKMPYCGARPGLYDGICRKTCTERQAPALSRDEWNLYRSDCSGFISWVWQLDYADGHRTWGFAPFDKEGPPFSEVIAPLELEPGDALNSATTDIFQQHIVLFAGWVDRARGVARTIEEANCADDLVVTPERVLTVRPDGTVGLGGKIFWPIRKLGIR